MSFGQPVQNMTRNGYSNANKIAEMVPSMKNKAWSRRMMFAAFLAVAGNTCANANSRDASPTVSLCEVLTHPSNYSGRKVKMTVRITSTKEGGFLWTPSCRSLGVATLQIDDAVDSDSGISDLLDLLRSHGLSDHPVIATLAGTFIYNPKKDEHRQRSVFKANAASNLKLSNHLEHP
jgi:hypothetical protein